ncbi:epoxide hydrolase, soluble (sEH) [Ascosphaera pollenicola]|nr:epoxide hydrolase, soluble (sEH) [Ascosphaera pollenicola]
MTSFADFSSGHQDAVTVTRFNFYGNRILTASSDHHVKVWDQDPKSSEWTLTDTWRAHDAEVRDAAWNGPFTGQHIGTVGEDMKFKLWQEDTTQPRNSGRRFFCCFRLTSPVRAPYVSLDFRNIALESWLALITRDGLLTVLEPVNPDTLSEWQQIDQFRVCAEPARGDETSFKLQFHRDPMDMTHVLHPGWDSRSLSLVVAAMDTVKIYRTDANRKFYHAFELSPHNELVRDVSWASGSIRGFDLIASGCKDGKVRVWEVYTTVNDKNNTRLQAENQRNDGRTQQISTLTAGLGSPVSSSVSSNLPRAMPNVNSQYVGQHQQQQASQSNIASALALSSRSPNPYAPMPTPGTLTPRPGDRDGIFSHTAKQVACIDSQHLDVWQVEFSQAGDCLLSSGDDGMVRFWKRSVDGEWLEFAEADLAEE